MKENDYDLILDYLYSRLSKKKRVDFERRLESEDALRAALDRERSLNADPCASGLYHAGLQSGFVQFPAIDFEISQPFFGDETWNHGSRPRRRQVSTAAAVASAMVRPSGRQR